MIEARDQHFVTGPQRASESTAEVKCQRRHIGAEDDFLCRGCIEQIGGGLMRFVQDGVGFAAGREDAALVGVARGQVMHHRIDDALRHLRPAGPVEENRRAGSCPTNAIQRRELLAESIDIEHHNYRPTSTPGVLPSR